MKLKMLAEKMETKKEKMSEMKKGKKMMKKFVKKTVKKVKGTIPKTKKGKTMVAKLGRTKKTGGFAKIAKKASKEYGSKKAGQKVAGAIYQKMVANRKK